MRRWGSSSSTRFGRFRVSRAALSFTGGNSLAKVVLSGGEKKPRIRGFRCSAAFSHADEEGDSSSFVEDVEQGESSEAVTTPPTPQPSIASWVFRLWKVNP